MMSDQKQTCETIQGLLADAAVGALSVSERAALAEHLAACPACRERAAELRATAELLEAAPEIDPSPGFDAALEARLDIERRRERARRVTLAGLLIAAVRHVRRFELGAAVYPLVLMGLAYVAWSMVTGGPEHRPLASDYAGEKGILRLYPPSDRSRARDMIAHLKSAAPRDFEAIDGNPFDDPKAEPEPKFHLIVVRPALPRYVDPPVAGADEPRELDPEQALEVIQELSDPPPSVPVALPVGGAGGPALARARFNTIKNSDAYLHGSIARGLVWLMRNQERDGRWTGSAGRGVRRAEAYSDPEVTAAVALAFMQSGFTPSGRSAPSRRLRAALTWLVRQRRPDHTFAPPGARQIHTQAMVITALSEAMRLTDREVVRSRFRHIIRSALAVLMRRQGRSGEWQGPELTAMALMATGSARAAGFAVNADAQKLALAWLVGYRKSRSGTAMASLGPQADGGTAVAYAGIGEVLGSDNLFEGAAQGVEIEGVAKELEAAPVVWESGDFFRWYAGTLVAYRLNGSFWQRWRSGLLLQLIPRQRGAAGSRKAAALRGSWAPHGLCRSSGRSYTTALAVLSLAATCGHSPVYGSAK